MKRLSRSNFTKRWWKLTLGFSLGLAVSSASAGEVQWHAASSSKPAADPPSGNPPAQVIATTGPAAAGVAAAPAVSILAPVPLPPASAAQPLQPVAYSDTTAPGSRIVFRAQMTDANRTPKAMPVGLPESPEDLPSGPSIEGLPPPSGTTGAPMPPVPPVSPVPPMTPAPAAACPPGQPCPHPTCSPCPCPTGSPCPCPTGQPCPCPTGSPCPCPTGQPCPCGSCGSCSASSCGHCLLGELGSWWLDHFGHCACPDDGDAPNNHLWVSAEYLLWWIKGQSLPALVTTGSPNDHIPGALGQPNTFVLYGNGNVSEDVRSGLRFRAGWWFTDDHSIGVDGSFFFLGDRSVNFIAGSNGSPALFRPFLDAGFPAGHGLPTQPFEDAEIVAFPGVAAGAVAVSQSTRLQGYELNVRGNLLNGSCDGYCYTIDGYAGFRSLVLDEDLQITESITSVVPGAPGSLLVRDWFSTGNRFYGGQVGINAEARFGLFYLDLNTQVAAGNVHQMVDILGGTSTTTPSGSTFSPGGLLAQRSNTGHFDRDRFAVLPEVGVTFGYHVTDYLRVFVGYNFLYISNVARPAQQIDRVVNPTFIPGSPIPASGPARPSFTFHETDFYAQGINFGLEFRW
jgi:hypothetical protein